MGVIKSDPAMATYVLDPTCHDQKTWIKEKTDGGTIRIKEVILGINHHCAGMSCSWMNTWFLGPGLRNIGRYSGHVGARAGAFAFMCSYEFFLPSPCFLGLGRQQKNKNFLQSKKTYFGFSCFALKRMMYFFREHVGIFWNFV